MRVPLCLVVVPLWCLSSLAGQVSSAADSPPKPVIEGRVVDQLTHAPLRKATVELWQVGKPAPELSATSDQEGGFRFDDLPTGTYWLRAVRLGYLPAHYGARRSTPQGAELSVSAGQKLSGLVLKMTPQAVIAGTVVDGDGDPLPRVAVSLVSSDNRQVGSRPTENSLSNDIGEFRLANVSVGTYYLVAQRVEGPIVQLLRSPKVMEQYVATFFPEAISLAAAQPLAVKAGQQLTGLQIRLQKTRVYPVRGKVMAGVAGAGVRDGRLFLTDREEVGPARPVFGGHSRIAVVAPDGTFVFAGVPSGSYWAVAVARLGNEQVIAREPLQVGDAPVDNLHFTLSPGLELRGEIQREEGPEALPGRIMVQLRPEVPTWFGNPAATAQSDGTFTITGVSPDRYELQVTSLPENAYVKSVRYGDQELKNRKLDLLAGAAGKLLLTVSTGGAINGSVQADEGIATAGTVIVLLPQGAGEERQATTDQSGHFAVKGVVPSKYRLYAWEDIEPGAWHSADWLKKYEGQEVEVGEKATVSVQVKQIRAE